MRKLVVYYSFEGNTEYIANNIAEAVEADILKLVVDKEPQTHGFMKYIWGGKQVVTKEIPKLRAFDKNPQDYDLIFIGTPVWAFTYAPAISAFFENIKLEGKNIALFCSSHGSKGKTFENMKACLVGNNILEQIDFIEPKGKKAEAERAVNWAKKIVSVLN